jgi:hypothetical protein
MNPTRREFLTLLAATAAQPKALLATAPKQAVSQRRSNENVRGSASPKVSLQRCSSVPVIGLRVLYHNREWESANRTPDGRIAVDALFDDTEHSAVRFLLDAGHVCRGGSDVITLIKRRLERIAAFHMRDFVIDKEVSPGQGNFPRAQCAAVLRGKALDEKDNDGGQKLGQAVIEPAYHTLSVAFALGQGQ